VQHIQGQLKGINITSAVTVILQFASLERSLQSQSVMLADEHRGAAARCWQSTAIPDW
jgi:hypothetical protein